MEGEEEGGSEGGKEGGRKGRRDGVRESQIEPVSLSDTVPCSKLERSGRNSW